MNDQYISTPTANAPVVFNLADFEAVDSAWLEVQNKKEDGPLLFNGQPVRIEVRSPGTREAMQIQHKQESAVNARTFAAMRGKPVKETVDGKLSEKAEKLTAVTVRIENFPVSLQELYLNPRLGYIAKQVAEFHADWANF